MPAPSSKAAGGDDTGPHHDLTVLVIEQVQVAIAAGTDPASPDAAPVVAQLIDAYTRTCSRSDTTSYRVDVLYRLQVAADPRTHRYLELLAQMNGWPPQPDLTPVFEWFTHALETHRSGGPEVAP